MKKLTPIQQVIEARDSMTRTSFINWFYVNEDRLLKEEEDNKRKLLLSFIEWSNAYDYNRNKLDSIDISNFLLQ